jgi:hypothetical protein
MSDQLISILTEIRDQQKQQIVNFERAVQSQADFVALQKKGRKTLTFMIFAPWAAMVLLLLLQLWFEFTLP